jgi:hypothetical protein
MLARISMLIFCAALTMPAVAQQWHEQMKSAQAAEAAGDLTTAQSIYTKLAKQEIPVAMNALGYLYAKQNKPKDSLFWCTVASGYGHAVDFGCLRDAQKQLSKAEIDAVRALADQCRASKFQACDVLDARWNKNIKEFAATRCFVNDPTGTDLNYRTSPGGKVLGQIANLSGVTIMDQAKDNQGRAWVFVKGVENDAPLGWVIRSYLKCQG